MSTGRSRLSSGSWARRPRSVGCATTRSPTYRGAAMRLSELLHARVIDSDGADLGGVDDVLLVQDGPFLDPFGAAFRVEGLVVGHRAVGTRLGYHRGDVTGPWLLKAFFSRLARGAKYVPWEAVEEWD